MTTLDTGPVLAALALLAASTMLGMTQVVKLIRMNEAKHELKQGSAGFLRSMSGWVVIVLWLMAVWFVATVIGDWGASGDLEGAIARAELRLYVLLEIASALSD